MPRTIAVQVINFYQAFLSPDHSWLKAKHPAGYCRHYPSCSEYTKQAIVNFGLTKGFYLGAKRILKCHPWAEPKIDLVPKQF